jgi:hypothetical protein
MPVLTNTLELPDQTKILGAVVRITLVGAAATPIEGWVGSTPAVVGTFNGSTDATGKWTLTVPSNLLINPPGTVYKVVETLPDGSVFTNYASVPNGAGPYNLYDVLVSAPSSIAAPDTVPLSTITAKGDLIAGTATSAVTHVSVGSNGTVLTANSSATGGVDWEAPVGGIGAAINAPPVIAIGTQTSVRGAITGRAALEDHNHGLGPVTDTWGGSFPSPIAGVTRYCGTVQQACTAASITAWAKDGGAACATVNALHGTTLAAAVTVKIANQSISGDAIASGTADQNSAIAAGHGIWVKVVTVPGSPTEVGVQLNTTV